jgi:hypothetical protein
LGVEGLLDGALIVLKERTRRRCSAEELGEEVAKVQSLLHSLTQSDVLSLSRRHGHKTLEMRIPRDSCVSIAEDIASLGATGVEIFSPAGVHVAMERGRKHKVGSYSGCNIAQLHVELSGIREADSACGLEVTETLLGR